MDDSVGNILGRREMRNEKVGGAEKTNSLMVGITSGWAEKTGVTGDWEKEQKR